MYFMEGRHRTKIHLRVKTVRGSNAWCGQHSSYSMDVMEAEAFLALPTDKQCKRCQRAFAPMAKQPCDVCGTPVPVNAVSPSECFCSLECCERHYGLSDSQGER